MDLYIFTFTYNLLIFIYMSPARAWLGEGPPPPPPGQIETFGGGPWASISKAKSIRGIFKSANPGVGGLPPLFGPFGPQELQI